MGRVISVEGGGAERERERDHVARTRASDRVRIKRRCVTVDALVGAAFLDELEVLEETKLEHMIPARESAVVSLGPRWAPLDTVMSQRE